MKDIKLTSIGRIIVRTDHREDKEGRMENAEIALYSRAGTVTFDWWTSKKAVKDLDKLIDTLTKFRNKL